MVTDPLSFLKKNKKKKRNLGWFCRPKQILQPKPKRPGPVDWSTQVCAGWAEGASVTGCTVPAQESHLESPIKYKDPEPNPKNIIFL